MDISIIIPTRNRVDKISECVRSLRRQELPRKSGLTGRFEVIVSLDGQDEPVRAAVQEAWRNEHGREYDEAPSLHVIDGAAQGLAAARNRALDIARGRWIVSINDDVYAQPGFLAAHALGHLEALAHGGTPGGSIIVGDSPFRAWSDDSLFDRLVRDTSMVFFYDRMNRSGEAANADRDWGFRHCFGLNHSVEALALREVGGYTVFPARYGYEDIEAAWKLRERFGSRVLYRPAAKGTHDHRITPQEYLSREHTLGHAALGFAMTAPGCARETFGRDVTTADEIEYSREFVKREAAAAESLRGSFQTLAQMRSDSITGPGAATWMRMVYEQHLLLKRWEWRRGLVQAADEQCTKPVGVRVPLGQGATVMRAA